MCYSSPIKDCRRLTITKCVVLISIGRGGVRARIDVARKGRATKRARETAPSLFGLSRRGLGACPNSRCSILSESDSTLGYEQVFSPLEYRSDTAAAAECAGLRAERPCLAVYR